MRLEAGKYYVRRDGSVVGPAENRSTYFAVAGWHYYFDGTHRYGDNRMDLVAEAPVYDQTTEGIMLQEGKYYRFDVEGSHIIGPLKKGYKGWSDPSGAYLRDDGTVLHSEKHLHQEVTFETVPAGDVKVGDILIRKSDGVIYYVRSTDLWYHYLTSLYDSFSTSREGVGLFFDKVVCEGLGPKEPDLVEGKYYLYKGVYGKLTRKFLSTGHNYNGYELGMVWRCDLESPKGLVRVCETSDIEDCLDNSPYSSVDMMKEAFSLKKGGHEFLGVSLQNVENPSYEDGTLYLCTTSTWGRPYRDYCYFQNIKGESLSFYMDEQEGWKLQGFKELPFKDPVLDNFQVTCSEVFSVECNELVEYFRGQLPAELQEKFSLRSRVMRLRQAKDNRANLVVYLNQKQKDSQRIQSLRPGRALRAILPEISDAELEKVVDKFRRDYPTSTYTVKRGFDAGDFKHMYSHTIANMQNPWTTDHRKSLGNSCMRDPSRYSHLPHHPAEAYASGEFEAVWTEAPDGRIGSRMVVWHPPKGHRLHGTPQCGPVYGTCEYSMDLVVDLMKSEGAEIKGTWQGAKMAYLPHKSTLIVPYLDYERWLTVEGNYLVLDEDDGDYQACSYGGTIHEVERYQCDDCGEYVDGDDCYTAEGDRCVCQSCIGDYFYCDWAGEYIHNDNGVTVMSRSWSGTYNETRVSESCADNNYVECTDGLLWPTDYCLALANGDWANPHWETSGEYYECVVDNEWYHKDEGYFTEVGDFIAKENFDDTTHYLDENSIVREREAA